LDLDLLGRQHAAFVTVLASLGCTVETLPAADDMCDACFVYDPSFVTGRGVLEFRGAKAVRAGEPPLLAAQLAEQRASAAVLHGAVQRERRRRKLARERRAEDCAGRRTGERDG
jgi:N-dimethylarginine dimethylaminohydrolase